MSKNKTTDQEVTETTPEQETPIVHPAQIDPVPAYLLSLSNKEFRKEIKRIWDAAQPPKTPKSVLPKKVAEKSAEEQTKYVEDTLAKLQARLAELTAFRNATPVS